MIKNTFIKLFLVTIACIFSNCFNTSYAFKVNSIVIEPVTDTTEILNNDKQEGLMVIDANGTLFVYNGSRFIEQLNSQSNTSKPPFVTNADTDLLLVENNSLEIELNGYYFTPTTQFTNLPSNVTQTILEINPNYAKIQLQNTETVNISQTEISFGSHEEWNGTPTLTLEAVFPEEIILGTNIIAGNLYKIGSNTPFGEQGDVENYNGENYLNTIYEATSNVTVSYPNVRVYSYALKKSSVSNIDPPPMDYSYTITTTANQSGKSFAYYTAYLDQDAYTFDHPDLPLSCKAYKDSTNTNINGLYLIKTNFQNRIAYCEMKEDDGGWTLVLKMVRDSEPKKNYYGGSYKDTEYGVLDEDNSFNALLSKTNNSVTGGSSKFFDSEINLLARGTISVNSTNDGGSSGKIAYRITTSDSSAPNIYYYNENCGYSEVTLVSTTLSYERQCNRIRNSYHKTTTSFTQMSHPYTYNIKGLDIYRTTNDNSTRCTATTVFSGSWDNSGNYTTTSCAGFYENSTYSISSSYSDKRTYDLLLWVREPD